MPEKYKTMVKLSAPANIDGMLGRETFDVPATPAGAAFVQWWERAPAEKRAEVLKYANDNNTDVVDALIKVHDKCVS